ncbi:hypothetical protein [Cochlodiniinecator piscidefendens]|uniref:hypothetical protein n=1 Tax=Cochlodiniinecator piscidefendens TaxID=2715756 RepID=UPI00140C59CF|nr:hypothetical protein [Cochlodiniinecator piscidefendens]
MTRALTLLHTSPVHSETFVTLNAALGTNLSLTQHVHSDWLSRAISDGITDDLATEMKILIEASDAPVLCTCTTLGPLAETLGAIRIDRPMMEKAAALGGKILMVYALDSTRAPSTLLLEACITAAETDAEIISKPLTEFWPLFEAGETEAFTACVAGAIRAYLADHPDTNCVVIAQASMAGAAPLLADCTAAILTSPETALRQFI